jgi:hypothetical protein
VAGKGWHLILKTCKFFAMLLSAIYCPVILPQIHVLVDQVGYESDATKIAIVEEAAGSHPTEFALVDANSGKTVLQRSLVRAGNVGAWNRGTFWTADFAEWKISGSYRFLALRLQSAPVHLKSVRTSWSETRYPMSSSISRDSGLAD